VTHDEHNWWRGAVLYQVYPRSFRDTNGDGVGDLNGITDNLEYIASLGVDGVWICPFYRSPMADFGYDIADYRDVDPIFGSLADFDRLIERAHALGLKVVIDQVYAYTSTEHAWFAESRSDRTNPKADWYLWADPKPDGSPPNNWMAAFGGIGWTWDSRRRQYYHHHFTPGQPHLNLHCDGARAAVIDVARFWLARGVDGFRLDVANFWFHSAGLEDNPPSSDTDAVKPWDMQAHVHDRSQPQALGMAAEIRALCDERSGVLTMAELATSQPARRMAEFTSPGRLHSAYSWVFLGDDISPELVRSTVEEVLASAPNSWPAWSFSNHDRPRVLSRWRRRDRARWARTLVALLTSLPGLPIIYQGEELALEEADIPFDKLRDPEGIAFWPEVKGRDGCRTPLPWSAGKGAGFTTAAESWLPIPAAHEASSIADQTGRPDSMLSFVRGWLAWRKRQPAMTGGVQFLDLADDLLVFRRSTEGQSLTCLFNLSDDEVVYPSDGLGDRVAFDLGGRVAGSDVVLPGSAALILRS